MKLLSARRLGAAAALLLGIPAVLLGAASLPRHGVRSAAPPRVDSVAHGKGPLAAGAAHVRFELPAGVPIAGFARLSWASEGVRDPVGARALVLSTDGCRIALVSADLLLIPDALVEAVEARLADVPLDGLVLAATHTHAGPGAYWEDPLGERLATGPFDPHVRDAIANAIAHAVRAAAGSAAPARLSVGRGHAQALARSRSGGAVDARLTVLRVDRPDGEPLAEVTIFPAHPTTLGKGNHALSGDFAGRFLSTEPRGLRLFFQGALGDQSVILPGSPVRPSPEAYGDALSRAVEALRAGPPDPAPALGFAQAEVVLPSPELGAAPPFLRRAAANVAWEVLPARARVAAVRLGPVVLLAVPGEPVAEVGARWRDAAGDGAEILSLANGYLGYVEAPARMVARRGETERTYYGPALAERLGRAASAAAEAAREQGGGGRGEAPRSARLTK